MNGMTIPPLVPLSTISSIWTSINNSSSLFVLFRHTCHANPGADKKYAGPSSDISMYSLQEFSNKSANSSISLWTYRSWWPRFCIPKYFKLFCHVYSQHLWCLPLLDCYKILSLLIMKFYWIYLAYPWSHKDKQFSTTWDKFFKFLSQDWYVFWNLFVRSSLNSFS